MIEICDIYGIKTCFEILVGKLYRMIPEVFSTASPETESIGTCVLCSYCAWLEAVGNNIFYYLGVEKVGILADINLFFLT